MSKSPRHHYQAEGGILCGCESFVAYSEARYGCLNCVRRLDDLIHALRSVVRHQGLCDFTGLDKRTRRAIDFAFANEPVEAPVERPTAEAK